MLGRLRTGSIVELRGQLVDIEGREGGMRTSLSRRDTGAGACEILLASSARVARSELMSRERRRPLSQIRRATCRRTRLRSPNSARARSTRHSPRTTPPRTWPGTSHRRGVRICNARKSKIPSSTRCWPSMRTAASRASRNCRTGARRPACRRRSRVELRRFYVDKPWQGRGLARELMTAVEDEARGARRARVVARRLGTQCTGAGVLSQVRLSQRWATQVFVVGSDPQTDEVMLKEIA